MRFHTLYDPPASPSVTFTKPSLTEQSHRSEVEINDLIARYNRTGVLGSPTQVREMFFGDFSHIGTRFEAECDIAAAKQRFLALPSKVRSEFGHDPRKFLAAVDKLGTDEHTLKRFVELGLVKAPEPAVGTQAAPADVTPAQKLDGTVNS